MMTPNEEVNVNVRISPGGDISSSRGYELVFAWEAILSCSVVQFPGRNNSTTMNIRARENNASASLRCGWDSLRHHTARCFYKESGDNATMVSCLCVDNIWTPDPYCYNSRESNMMTTNEEVNVNVRISPNGEISLSRGYELVFAWEAILNCSVARFPGRNNNTMTNIRARKNNARARENNASARKNNASARENNASARENNASAKENNASARENNASASTSLLKPPNDIMW